MRKLELSLRFKIKFWWKSPDEEEAEIITFGIKSDSKIDLEIIPEPRWEILFDYAHYNVHNFEELKAKCKMN